MNDLSEKVRLFVDMDGTLAKFIPQDTLEPLFEKDYFSSLEPMQNVVEAVNFLNVNDVGVDVYILSACLDTEFAKSEKNEWLDKYLPSIKPEQRIFVDYGENKSEVIPEGIRLTDFLLDDYTKNLNDWCLSGGQGIKILNGINNRSNSWDGPRIDHEKNSVTLKYELISKINSTIINLQNKDLIQNLDKNISEISGIAARKDRAIKRSEELCRMKNEVTLNLTNGKER